MYRLAAAWGRSSVVAVAWAIGQGSLAGVAGTWGMHARPRRIAVLARIVRREAGATSSRRGCGPIPVHPVPQRAASLVAGRAGPGRAPRAATLVGSGRSARPAGRARPGRPIRQQE